MHPSPLFLNLPTQTMGMIDGLRLAADETAALGQRLELSAIKNNNPEMLNQARTVHRHASYLYYLTNRIHQTAMAESAGMKMALQAQGGLRGQKN